jgi:hypothetical protein
MSRLGDVVFCVDCERNAEASRSAVGAPDGQEQPPPRRMAVKKDANGDRLCAPCLDARRANRNTAFLRQEGRQENRAPSSTQGSTGLLDGAVSAEPPARPRILRIASAVRITRSRSSDEALAMESAVPQVAAPAATKVDVPRGKRLEKSAPKARERARVPQRTAKQRGAQERAFVQLAAEVGFVRTRELLGQLKQKLRGLR